MNSVASTPTPSPAWTKWFLAFALLLLGLGYARNLHNPLFDRHSFRQTQTAAVIDGLAAGESFTGTKLYVLGPPWVMPIEFPLYQKVASYVVQAGVSTPVAARLVSIFAFLGCLAVLHRWLHRVGFPHVNLTLALIALFPTYQMWSRASLIESTALLLALGSLALFWGLLEGRGSALRVALLVAVSTLAVLQKLNAYLIVSAFVAFYLLVSGRWRERRLYGPLLLVWAVNIAALLVWGRVTDAARAGNLLAERLSGSSHLAMLLGTVGDRFSVPTYLHLLARGFLADALLVAVAVLVWWRGWHRTKPGAVALSLMLAVGAVHFLFLRVYSIHDYYHFSSTVYVLIGVAYVITQVLPERRVPLLLAAAALFGMVANEGVYQRRLELTGQTWREPYQLIAGELERTPREEIVLVLGDDWSSAVSYVAGRKTWAIPTWATEEFLRAPRPFAAACGVKSVSAVVIVREDFARHAELLRSLYGTVPEEAVRRFPDAQTVVVHRSLSLE